MVTTAAVAFVGVGAAAAYIDLRSQMEVHDITELVGDDLPVVEPTKDPDDPFAGKALNILVMGTDMRDEANAEIAGGGGEFASDTTLVVHVSGDRRRMEVVSIPRDSLVTIPECVRPDGTRTYEQYGAMFNSAFATGGGPEQDLAHAAACTQRTVMSLTGVPITSHVVVKMTGVIGVVDAVGGVRMCLPEPVKGGSNSPDLDLEAGEQVLDGRTAISFIRARKGTGMGLEMGSDLARIERQQAFLDATVRQITSKNLLTNSPELYSLVEAVLQSISTSPDLGSPQALAGLAVSLRGIDPSQVEFTSVPVVDAPSDPNRVVWTAEAAPLWERIAADEPPPGWEAPDEPTDGTTDGATDDATEGASEEPTDDSTDPRDDAPEDPTDDATDGPSGGETEGPEDEPLPGVCDD